MENPLSRLAWPVRWAWGCHARAWESSPGYRLGWLLVLHYAAAVNAGTWAGDIVQVLIAHLFGPG